MSQKVWLTGSRGFVGRVVVATFRRAGAQVWGCTNQAVTDVPSGLNQNPFVQVNYLDPEDIKAKIRHFGMPDLFIHSGWAAMDKPESPLHLEENVPASRTLINTLFSQGLRTFLFIGSMNEYGARTGALAEGMEPEGRLTNYAKAKREAAADGFEAAKVFGKTFIHARTFYVYGAGQRSGSLINDLYQASLTGAEVSLSPCEHYRDYIHVSEVAEGLRRISLLPESTTVNLGSGTVVQVKDFVLLLWKALGGDPGKLRFGARKVGWDEPEQPKSYADLARLKQLASWCPTLSLQQGVDRTVEDLRQAVNGR
jgi:dTDP-6-deoxy-L-talose 4-dehydrogenase (NAD+)